MGRNSIKVLACASLTALRNIRCHSLMKTTRLRNHHGLGEALRGKVLPVEGQAHLVQALVLALQPIVHVVLVLVGAAAAPQAHLIVGVLSGHKAEIKS